MLIVSLVEEDVLSVAAIRRKIFERSIFRDPVLGAQGTPEL